MVKTKSKRIVEQNFFGGLDFVIGSKLASGQIWISGALAHQSRKIEELKFSIDSGKTYHSSLEVNRRGLLKITYNQKTLSQRSFLALCESSKNLTNSIQILFLAKLKGIKAPIHGQMGRFKISRPLILRDRNRIELERKIKSKRAKLKRALKIFLSSTSQLEFLRPPQDCQLSVIVALHNQPDLILATLQALRKNHEVNAEVILVDNASDSETQRLLKKVKGVRILRNKKNLHFIMASNQGAALARGRYLLFLNSDCQVAPDGLRQALHQFSLSKKIGIVCGQILNVDGTNQEAGFRIYRQSWPLPIGYGEDSQLRKFQKAKAVEACSGAFLMTPAKLFKQIGGFNMIYYPAYFEDIHYCLEVRKRGLQIFYQPKMKAVHFGRASLVNDSDYRLLLERNLQIFKSYWLSTKNRIRFDEAKKIPGSLKDRS